MSTRLFLQMDRVHCLRHNLYFDYKYKHIVTYIKHCGRIYILTTNMLFLYVEAKGKMGIVVQCLSSLKAAFWKALDKGFKLFVTA